MRSVECSEFSVQRGLANSSTFAHGPTHAIPVPDSGRQARAATVPLSQVVPTTCCTPTTICLQHVVRMDSLSCGAGPCQSALRQSLQSRALLDAIGSLGRSNAYSCRFETTRTASHLRHPPRLRLRRSQTIHLHIRPLRPINMQGKKVATRKVARRGVGKWWRPLAPASRSHRGLGSTGSGQGEPIALFRTTLSCKIVGADGQPCPIQSGDHPDLIGGKVQSHGKRLQHGLDTRARMRDDGLGRRPKIRAHSIVAALSAELDTASLP